MKRDLERFYSLLQDLERRLGGKRQLGETHGRMPWPARGVYFFFEPGEYRREDQGVMRVVRVGTHALRRGSRTTLWNRLSQHRGTMSGGGNHRGSIFRLHTGAALLARANAAASLPSWGRGSNAKREVKDMESHHEAAVSEYLGRMSLLWLPVEDEAGNESDRGLLERNSIGLLSTIGRRVDPASESWLGRWSVRRGIRESGLWNLNHVGERYDPAFLQVLERYIVQV